MGIFLYFLFTNSLLEDWMNLVNLDDFFIEKKVEYTSVFIEYCMYFGEQLVNLWSQKPYFNFPDKNFDVKCIKDLDEVYTVFYEQIN